MPSDARALDKEALRRAHEACPCRTNAYTCSCLVCDCKMRVWAASGTAEPPLPDTRCECGWPGHAAIDALRRAVREADKEAADGWWVKYGQDDRPSAGIEALEEEGVGVRSEDGK